MKFTEQDRQQIKTLLNSDTLKNGLLAKSDTPIKIVDIDKISNNVWLFLRALLGVGGSECAGLMNVSPYTNPIKIYSSKFPYLYREPEKNKGIMTDEEIENVIATLEKNNPDKDSSTQFLLDYGHYMEEFIAKTFTNLFEEKYKDDFEDMFSRKYGKYMQIKDVEVYKDSYLYRHANLPLFADMDYRIRISFDDGQIFEGVFECKTSSSYQVKSKWENGVPEYYKVQCEHYMAVANVDFYVICCLADNSLSNFYAYLGFRNTDIENKLLNKVNDFWFNSVVPHKTPNIDLGVDALDDLLASIDIEEGSNEEQAQELGSDAFDLCKEREELLAKKKQCNDEIKAIDSQIAAIETQLVLKCDNKAKSVVSSNDETFNIELIEKTSSRFDKNQYFKLFPTQKNDYLSCVKQTTKNTVSIKKTA